MPDFEPRDLVTTREAAAILGVGTTSIKRWADRGQLPCVRTAGGHRRFSRAAVLAFRRIGIEEFGETEAVADPAWIEEWLAVLIGGEGDESGAREALARERDRRGSWIAVADALGPVLEELGRRWATGDITVVEEHVASSRLARAMATSARRANHRDAPRAMLVSAPSDDHTLGLSLCELVLREVGWTPVWIGPRAPTAELCAFIARRRPEAVLMSASSYSTDSSTLAAQVERVGEACRRVGAELAVGGRGRWPHTLAHGHRLYRFSELVTLLSPGATESAPASH